MKFGNDFFKNPRFLNKRTANPFEQSHYERLASLGQALPASVLPFPEACPVPVQGSGKTDAKPVFKLHFRYT